MFKRLLTHSILVFLSSLVLLFFGIGLGLFLMRHTSEITICDFLQNYKTSLIYWRCSLFILLMFFWRPLIAGWGKVQQWPKRYIVKILQWRIKVVIFFILLESLLWITH